MVRGGQGAGRVDSVVWTLDPDRRTIMSVREYVRVLVSPDHTIPRLRQWVAVGKNSECVMG